jgi:hypothetical protein
MLISLLLECPDGLNLKPNPAKKKLSAAHPGGAVW